MYSTFRITVLLLLVGTIFIESSNAQSREKGPWWPHPEWGPDDQAGASNRITPQKILEALQLVTKGKTYDLGQVYESGMPMYGNRTYSMVLPAKGPSAGANHIVGNQEFLATEIGQVGTQFDGLGHIGQEVKMDDGTSAYVFYNGYTASEMDSGEGLLKLGIEHIKPIVTRGILVDLARYKGLARLENNYEVTVDDVLGALKLQGMSADDIEPGDALFFRYGWSALWKEPQAYNTNPPGIGVEVAKWIADKKLTLVGSDSWSGEIFPNPKPELIFPVHQELMMKNGIFNLENMQFDGLVEDGVYEFLFIVNPIPFKGATGSPVRPIAIK